MKFKNLYSIFLLFLLLLVLDAKAFTKSALERKVSENYDPVIVTGKVVDEKGDPLPGVTVKVKSNTVGTSTGLDGLFSLQAPDDKGTLIFSFLGYLTQEIPINSRQVINVNMVPDSKSLSEVVVIGYGTTTKKDLVSSISSIKADDLKNQPVVNLEQVLQGKASGLEVTSNNGTPGSGATIRIRGNNSINGNNDPLYVLDGFIAGSGFDINSLNTNDIQSIEILKDATALAIYGTRGASGVILITTKNGTGVSKGKPQITLG
ncbi:TonB-dependent receptor plug domain-containing protein, partial [Daejeonella sp.]|uniref:TonB-dependent receptor plug domain-containing protein n=1 Tax=Daejeonella sp. TaxID=2805397 RepID=UPI0030C3A957